MSAEPAPPARGGAGQWVVWLFAIVGLVGVLAFIWLVVAVGSFGGGGAEPARVETAQGAEKQALALRYPQDLKGTNLLRMDVVASESGGGSGSYSGREDDVRNILLIDKSSGASRQLLATNEHRIADAVYFAPRAGTDPTNHSDPSPAGQTETAAAAPAYYLIVVEQLPRSGLQDVIVGTLDGARQATVMRGVDGVDRSWMHSDSRIALLVREKRRLHFRIVDVPTLKVVASRAVEIR